MKYTINHIGQSKRKGFVEISLSGTYDILEGLTDPETGKPFKPSTMFSIRNYSTSIEVEEGVARGYMPGDKIKVDITIGHDG